MPIHSIEPRRLYRQIADQIRTLIRAREFPAGTRLPPERDLARQLGVSRPSVREALIALEVEGLVEVRIGSGIYVLGSSGNGAPGTTVQAAMGPFELLRARWVIESECAALAAKHAKRAQIGAIAEATGNGALVAVVKMLWDERTGPLFTQLEHHYDSPDQWARAIAEHRVVLEAIAKRDPSAARGAMQRHLDKAYKRFSRSWDAKH